MKENICRTALVGLDLTQMDDVVIDYLPTLLKALPIEHVTFVHIARHLELPEEILTKYPDLIAPLDESITEDIRKKVDTHFEGSEADYDIVVQEGNPLENFLKIAKIKNADLIVMGRKTKLEGSGLLAGHIVRKSPTSIFFITEKHSHKLDNVLIPLDFSRHSALALSIGQKINERIGAQLHCSNVYKVPVGYYKTGKSYEEFADIMRSNAEADFKKFCKVHNLEGDLDCQFLLADGSVSHLLYQHSVDTNADLIVVGSRGRTKSSALLIGSIVEKLVLEDADVPVMVVKSKGESMSFFEALMKV